MQAKIDLTKTAEVVRKVAPRRRMDTFWHWVLAFCLGFVLCEIKHEHWPDPCPESAIVCLG